MYLCQKFYREAVRQRKALSRTSSNILLNSVQMGHNTHNLNQYHHINYNNHPGDCDLNSKLKDLKEESSQHSFSNIEVIRFHRTFHYYHYFYSLKFTLISVYNVSLVDFTACIKSNAMQKKNENKKKRKTLKWKNNNNNNEN